MPPPTRITAVPSPNRSYAIDVPGLDVTRCIPSSSIVWRTRNGPVRPGSEPPAHGAVRFLDTQTENDVDGHPIQVPRLRPGARRAERCVELAVLYARWPAVGPVDLQQSVHTGLVGDPAGQALEDQVESAGGERGYAARQARLRR